jgi:hypothetical protein
VIIVVTNCSIFAASGCSGDFGRCSGIHRNFARSTCTDGVAQYGLYADWTTDLIRQAGADGTALRQQLFNGG